MKKKIQVKRRRSELSLKMNVSMMKRDHKDWTCLTLNATFTQGTDQIASLGDEVAETLVSFYRSDVVGKARSSPWCSQTAGRWSGCFLSDSTKSEPDPETDLTDEHHQSCRKVSVLLSSQFELRRQTETGMLDNGDFSLEQSWTMKALEDG